MQNENTQKLLKITGVLTAITVFVAVLLSVIYTVCAPIIAENTQKEKQDAVTALFPDATGIKSLDEQIGDLYPEGIREVYAVFEGDKLLGFCADTAFRGFEDEIEMMIGIDTQNVVRGIRILSIADTPGVGLQVAEESYLDSFYGMNKAASVAADGITGATYSSKAVINGVNTALAFCSMIEVTGTQETEATETAVPDTESAGTDAAESTAEAEAATGEETSENE